MHFLGGL